MTTSAPAPSPQQLHPSTLTIVLPSAAGLVATGCQRRASPPSLPRRCPPTADHRTGVAHATARRGRDASNEADSRLLHRVMRQEIGCIDFALAADLADHDDLFRFRVGQEHFQDLNEVGALHRVAADPHASALAKPGRSGLRHRLIGQRAGTRDNADAATADEYAPA